MTVARLAREPGGRLARYLPRDHPLRAMAAGSGPAYRASMPAAHARSAALASDPVSQFFGMLGQPGHLTTFEGESATLRFDLLDGKRTDRWYLTVADGEVAVTR